MDLTYVFYRTAHLFLLPSSLPSACSLSRQSRPQASLCTRESIGFSGRLSVLQRCHEYMRLIRVKKTSLTAIADKRLGHGSQSSACSDKGT